MELEDNKIIADKLMEYHKEVYDTILYIFEQDSLEEYFFPYDYFHLHEAAPIGVTQEVMQHIWEALCSDGFLSSN